MTAPDDPRLVDYLYDELTNEEASRFERLLAEDAEAQKEADSLEGALETLRAGLPAEDPAPHLDSKIMAYARQAAETKTEQGFSAKLRKFLRGPLSGLVAAGSLALIAAIVIMPQMMREPTFDSVDIAQQAARPAAVRDPDPAVGIAAAPESSPPPVSTVTTKLEPPAEEDAPDSFADGEREVASGQRSPERARKKAKAARQLESWEQERSADLDRRGGDAFLEGVDKLKGGEAEEPKKVVARFDAPRDEANNEPAPVVAEAVTPEPEAPAREQARRPAPKSPSKDAFDDALRDNKESDSSRAEGTKRESLAAADDAQARGEKKSDSAARPSQSAPAGLAAASEPSATAGPPAPPAAAPPPPSTRSRSAANAAPAAPGAGASVAPSPRALLADAKSAIAAGDRANALRLLESAVSAARGKPDEGDVLLEAADAALSLREIAVAERYATRAEKLPNGSRVADARRMKARAKVMRSESQSDAAKPTF